MTYSSLREKIAAESAERQGRYAKFEELYTAATAAGEAAAAAAVPTPMIVYETDVLVGDGLYPRDVKPGGKQWFETEGLCGFAWVKVRPANSSFARWLSKTGKVSGRAYHGGVDIWCSLPTQSIARKEAWARAVADVLKKGGIEAYADSRLD